MHKILKGLGIVLGFGIILLGVLSAVVSAEGQDFHIIIVDGIGVSDSIYTVMSQKTAEGQDFHITIVDGIGTFDSMG